MLLIGVHKVSWVKMNVWNGVIEVIAGVRKMSCVEWYRQARTTRQSKY